MLAASLAPRPLTVGEAGRGQGRAAGVAPENPLFY
jgi:hypothetical protein